MKFLGGTKPEHQSPKRVSDTWWLAGKSEIFGFSQGVSFSPRMPLVLYYLEYNTRVLRLQSA